METHCSLVVRCLTEGLWRAVWSIMMAKESMYAPSSDLIRPSPWCLKYSRANTWKGRGREEYQQI